MGLKWWVSFQHVEMEGNGFLGKGRELQIERKTYVRRRKKMKR